MKIVFVGWNENGEKCLTTILEHGFHVMRVLLPGEYETTRMKRIAKRFGIPVTVCSDVDEVEKHIMAQKVDLVIVASLPWILPEKIIKYPPLGIINIHAAKLPAYRGYHPINWALIKDEKEVGVTVHYVDSGMDSGEILAQASLTVTNSDDVITIRKKLTSTGAELLLAVLQEIKRSNKKLKGIKQNDSEASYAPKRKPEDGQINWSSNSRNIFNLIRSLKSPYPNAFSYLTGKKVEFQATYLNKQPGKILAKVDGHYLISTGDGVILVKTKGKLKIGETLG